MPKSGESVAPLGTRGARRQRLRKVDSMAAESRRSEATSQVRVGTGIDGLDDVLRGGFTSSRLYLVEGVPGSGKTTLAMQFLREGARRGEPVLYITLSETEAELREVAASHGWSLDGITIHELVPSEESLRPDEQYTMFHPSEVELNETTKSILADVERIKPGRVVFDSLSELRLLAGNPLRYRRQILLKQFFSGEALHRPAPGRSDQHGSRHPGSKHCTRRGATRANESRIRGRAAAAPCHQVSRCVLPWRISRLRHSSWRAPGLPATRRERTPRTAGDGKTGQRHP